MNVEASLFHHSPWYVEKVYEEGPGKDSAVFSVCPYSAKPWKQRHSSTIHGFPWRICPGYKERYSPKKLTLLQIQTDFFQCRYKLVSFQLPLTACLSMSSSAHFQNPCRPACQNFHAISEHDVLNSVTQKVWQKQQLLPSHVTATVSTDSNQCFYLLFILAEGISNTQVPFSFLNLLTFLQQKRAFRATYMQIMTHEFKVTLPRKPQWN